MTVFVDGDSLLRMCRITKSFPGVRALDGVDFDVRRGEIHALVGENGAGKSTLMHILAGVQQPDTGSIDLAGQTNVAIADQQVSQRLGIAIVYQERSLFGPLSIAENIFAGRQPARRFGHVDQAAMISRSQALLDEVGLRANPRTSVEHLSATQQQLVEIAKALSLDSRLFIFDEPTAALTLAETSHLFELIRRLKGAGRSVVYISHRLEEIFQLADRVTVLKDGRYQGTFAVTEITPDELIALMVGRELLAVDSRTHDAPLGDVALVTGPSLKEIFFEIDRLQSEPPPAQELQAIQRYLAGIFVLQNSSRNGIINQLQFTELHGLGENYLRDLVRKIYAVTPADVQRIAREYLKDDTMTIVIAGDKRVIEEQIKAFGTIME